MQSTIRILGRTLLTTMVITCLLFLIAGLLLRGSLPRYEGDLTVAGLSHSVSVERDSLGSVTLTGQNRLDLATSMGFIHAQERFFEMDLMRRQSAGELAELLGEGAIQHDRKTRKFRMRARAVTVLQQLTDDERQLLDAYRLGVNQGLQALVVRPFPYLLIQTQPAEWRNEDSILVIYAMFFTLNEENFTRELQLSSMHAALHESVFKFLTTPAGDWDAPLIDEPLALPHLPPEIAINLQNLDKQVKLDEPLASEQIPGSNSFAVSGALAGGSALIANDMHLTLRVPNLWFRTRLIYPDPSSTDQRHDITGLSLPGVPSIVIGSNRHITWSFTNSHGDFADWVRITINPQDPNRYQGLKEWQPVNFHEEIIRIRNVADETLIVSDTEWGPILHQDHDGTPLSLSWTALHPEAVNLKLIELEHTRTVHDAVRIAQQTGIPVQNFIVGDRSGNIGWTLAGRIPARSSGYNPQIPADWTVPNTGWEGWLPSERYPLILNPETQRLWSANSRTVSGTALTVLGNGGYDLGARATQIRDQLFARERFVATDMRAIQLDDRALLAERWQQRLATTLTSASKDTPWVSALENALQDWNRHAAADSVAYRAVHTFRRNVMKAVLNGFAAQIRQHDASFEMPRLSQAEWIVWQLIEHQPQHLLPSTFTTWEELLRHSAESTAEQLAQHGGITQQTWGEANAAQIRHPLSPKLPSWMARWLDMPKDPLPGDHNMPRVQSPSFGASQRSAVIPGQEEQSYMDMPGGQSGHPLSRYYGSGHASWVNGKPTPFLPGATEQRLTLSPGGYQRRSD